MDLWSAEQYEEQAVDVDVSVNGQLIGRQQLTYTFSSVDLARHLSTFYSRLLLVACQPHHHRHHADHHEQRQQSASEAAAAKSSALDELDRALVDTMNDASSAPACRRLFTVYRRRSGKSQHARHRVKFQQRSGGCQDHGEPKERTIQAIPLKKIRTRPNGVHP